MPKLKRASNAGAESIPWQLEQARVTLFVSEELLDTAESFWRVLTDSLPESVQSKPAQGVSAATGPYLSGLLHVQVQLGRIDIVLAPTPNDDPVALAFAGEFPESFVALISAVKKGLQNDKNKSFSEFARVALGAILLNPVKDRAEGYQQLQQLLAESVKIDPFHSSDFNYSINRPRPSAVIEDVRINRISRWSVAALVSIQNTIHIADGVVKLEKSGDSVKAAATRLELDINSAADQNLVISNDQVPSILDEMFQLAQEIGEQGDVK